MTAIFVKINDEQSKFNCTLFLKISLNLIEQSVYLEKLLLSFKLLLQQEELLNALLRLLQLNQLILVLLLKGGWQCERLDWIRQMRAASPHHAFRVSPWQLTGCGSRISQGDPLAVRDLS